MESTKWPVIVESFAIIFTCLGLLVWVCVSSARSDGRVTHCYIESSSTGYRVMGHREWRHDVEIAWSGSPEGIDKLLRDSALCSQK